MYELGVMVFALVLVGGIILITYFAPDFLK